MIPKVKFIKLKGILIHLEKVYKSIGFLALSFGFSAQARSQNYPIQAAVSLQTPLSNVFSQFVSEPDKITVTLLNKDFATPIVDAWLKMKLEGPNITLETNISYKPSAPITLAAGVPAVLNGSDISTQAKRKNMVNCCAG